MFDASPEELTDLSDYMNQLSADLLFVAVGSPMSPERELMLRQSLRHIGSQCLQLAGDAPDLLIAPTQLKEMSGACFVA